MEEEEKILSLKDIKQDFTLKVYPYLQEEINNVTEALNEILIDNFNYNTYNNCLFAKYRKKMGGFNHSLAIDFLIKIFDSLNNPHDVEHFLKKQLKEFIIEKDNIKIIEEEEKNDKKETSKSEEGEF